MLDTLVTAHFWVCRLLYWFVIVSVLGCIHQVIFSDDSGRLFHTHSSIVYKSPQYLKCSQIDPHPTPDYSDEWWITGDLKINIGDFGDCRKSVTEWIWTWPSPLEPPKIPHILSQTSRRTLWTIFLIWKVRAAQCSWWSCDATKNSVVQLSEQYSESLSFGSLVVFEVFGWARQLFLSRLINDSDFSLPCIFKSLKSSLKMFTSICLLSLLAPLAVFCPWHCITNPRFRTTTFLCSDQRLTSSDKSNCISKLRREAGCLKKYSIQQAQSVSFSNPGV